MDRYMCGNCHYFRQYKDSGEGTCKLDTREIVFPWSGCSDFMDVNNPVAKFEKAVQDFFVELAKRLRVYDFVKWLDGILSK